MVVTKFIDLHTINIKDFYMLLLKENFIPGFAHLGCMFRLNSSCDLLSASGLSSHRQRADAFRLSLPVTYTS